MRMSNSGIIDALYQLLHNGRRLPFRPQTYKLPDNFRRMAVDREPVSFGRWLASWPYDDTKQTLKMDARFAFSPQPSLMIVAWVLRPTDRPRTRTLSAHLGRKKRKMPGSHATIGPRPQQRQ